MITHWGWSSGEGLHEMLGSNLIIIIVLQQKKNSKRILIFSI